jgi:hypothetical protein
VTDWDQVLFTCAICKRDVRVRDSYGGRYKQLAPICTLCERDFGGPEPLAGSFRDRRRAVQISALSQALHDRAAQKEWSKRYAAT